MSSDEEDYIEPQSRAAPSRKRNHRKSGATDGKNGSNNETPSTTNPEDDDIMQDITSITSKRFSLTNLFRRKSKTITPEENSKERDSKSKTITPEENYKERDSSISETPDNKPSESPQDKLDDSSQQ